ncbi:MAG: enoyl-CoA hydratase/isomerase family protein [Acidimicrobiaceae bacterium]|nr:enoyl-CoA hydratase/isomerase family protein [Acidimicrobiaceae bacterium]
MSYETIRCEISGGLARLTLNRPDRLNGMTNKMVRETYEALTRVAADSSVRVLLLTGEGKGFCPGADLTHFSAAETDEPLSARHFRVTSLFHEIPAVTLAAINGACAGAGLGWALACDLRVMAASARMNTAFLDVAVAGDMGLPWTLPRIVGAARARELSFLPGKFGADEALRIGLVARVFADDTFRAETEAIVERLLAASPNALLTMKANYIAAERMPFADFIDLETERHLVITKSADTAEAFRAFVEKRPPRFAT